MIFSRMQRINTDNYAENDCVAQQPLMMVEKTKIQSLKVFEENEEKTAEEMLKARIKLKTIVKMKRGIGI